jgi:hypothetical protein
MIQLQSDGNANGYGACDDRVFALCLQPDGKTIIGGVFGNYKLSLKKNLKLV